MDTIVLHYEAFSTIPGKGNPAGVVLNGDVFAEEEMLKIAEQVGFNETVFVQQSETANLKLRYFTPGHEMNLCGHATMASLYALASKGILTSSSNTIETKAGILPIQLDLTNSNIRITMKQAPAQFVPFEGSVEELATSIGLTADEIDTSIPIVYGSTGIWTLLVPIRKLDSFQKMKPANAMFPEVLKEMPRASLHPFCLETIDPQADMHARHFSSPYSGTTEDPVTGTASGVMGAYYVKYIENEAKEGYSYRYAVEQGQEIGRDGRVDVHVVHVGGQYEVDITGTAVFVKEIEITKKGVVKRP